MMEFGYQVMLFDLQVAGATSQYGVIIIFKEMFRDMVKCYVDDLMVKLHQGMDHLKYLDLL